MVSVIIPVYNTSKYLKECIDSVLAQSFTDLEIILVNDGSTDDSGTICDEYSKVDKRVFVIHKKNGGLADARNHGVAAARGEFIFFLDSDDFIVKDAIEMLGKRQKSDDFDMVIFSYSRFKEDSSGREFLENADYTLKAGSYNSSEILGMFCYHSLSLVTACFKYIRADIAKKIIFPLGRICEDEFVAHHFIDSCSTIAVVEDKLYNYRDTPKSITNSKKFYQNTDRLFAIADRVKLLQSHGLLDAMHEQAASFFRFFSYSYPKQQAYDPEKAKQTHALLLSIYPIFKKNPKINSIDRLKINMIKAMPAPYCMLYNLIYR